MTRSLKALRSFPLIASAVFALSAASLPFASPGALACDGKNCAHKAEGKECKCSCKGHGDKNHECGKESCGKDKCDDHGCCHGHGKAEDGGAPGKDEKPAKK